MASSSVIGLLRVLLSANTAEFDSGMKSSAQTVDAWSKNFKQVGQQASSVGLALTKTLTLPLVALSGASIKAAMDFESSFAGVRKTVNASEAEFAQMAQAFRDLAKTIPINVNELNRLGEAAGALGIPKAEIVDFARVMAELGVTTNLTSDAAAEGVAKIQNVFAAAGKETENFASTLVALGNEGASTESEILSMATRIAGAGHAINMTQADVLAFASALSSVGIEAEMGGSAISRVFIDIASSVSKGGKDLEQFAKVAGKSVGDFANLFKTDAAQAVNAFIVGLNKVKSSGGDLLATLEELGFSEIRVRDTLLRAAGAGDILTKSLDTSKRAWRENSALTDEARKRYETTTAQLTLLWGRIQDVGITIGNALLPAVRTAMSAFNGLLPLIDGLARGFGELPGAAQMIAVGLGATVAAAGPLVFILGQLATSAQALTVAFGAKGVATKLLATSLGGLSTTATAAASAEMKLAAATGMVDGSLKAHTAATAAASLAQARLTIASTALATAQARVTAATATAEAATVKYGIGSAEAAVAQARLTVASSALAAAQGRVAVATAAADAANTKQIATATALAAAQARQAAVTSAAAVSTSAAAAGMTAFGTASTAAAGSVGLLGGAIAFLTNPITLLIAGLGVAAFAIYKVATAETDLEKAVRENAVAFKAQSDALQSALETYAALAEKHNRTREETARLDEATRLLAAASGLSVDAFNQEAQASSRLTKELQDQLAERKRLFDETVKQSRASAVQAQVELKRAQDELARMKSGEAQKVETTITGAGEIDTRTRDFSAEERRQEVARLQSVIDGLTKTANESEQAFLKLTGAVKGGADEMTMFAEWADKAGISTQSATEAAKTFAAQLAAAKKELADFATSEPARFKDLSEAIKSGHFELKELEKSSRLSELAFKVLTNELKDHTKAHKEVEKAAAKAARELEKQQQVLNQLGVVTGGMVADALKEFGVIEKLATDAGVPLNRVLAAMVPQLEDLHEKAVMSGAGVDIASAALKRAKDAASVLTDELRDLIPSIGLKSLREMPGLLTDMSEASVLGAINAKVLSEAYERFGLKTPAELRKVAAESVAAFETLKRSGTATPEQIAAAFKKMQEDIVAVSGIVKGSIVGAFAGVLEQVSRVTSGLVSVITGGLAHIADGWMKAIEAVKQYATQVTGATKAQKAAAVGGGVASVWGSTSTGGTAGRTASGAAAGAAAGLAIGAAFAPATLGLSLAIGAIGGALVGMFRGMSANSKENKEATAGIKKIQTELMNTFGSIEDVRKVGQALGQDITKIWSAEGKKGLEQFGAATDVLKARIEASRKEMSRLSAEGGVAGKTLLAFRDATRETAETIAFVKEQTSTAASGFSAFAQAGAAAYKKLDELREKFKTATGEERAQLAKEIQAQEAIIKAVGVSSQEAAAGIGAAFAGTFAALQEQGLSVREALEQMGPGIEAFRLQLEKTGFSGGAAFDYIARLAGIAAGEISGPALDAIHQLSMGLAAAQNAGFLTQEMFAGIVSQILISRQALLDQGATSEEVAMLMQKDLQKIWQLQQDFGFKVDDVTQELIDQGIEAGKIGDKFRDPMDRAAIAMEKVAKLLEGLAKKAGLFKDELDKVPRKVDVDINVNTRRAQQGFDDFEGAATDATDAVQDGVDGISFGRSPGGLKEIPIKLNEAAQAAAIFARKFGTEVGGVQGAIDGTTKGLDGIPVKLEDATSAAAVFARDFGGHVVAVQGTIGGATTKVHDLGAALTTVVLPPKFVSDVQAAVTAIGSLASAVEAVIRGAIGAVNSLIAAIRLLITEAQTAIDRITGVGGAITAAFNLATASAELTRVKIGEVKSAVADLGASLTTVPWATWADGVTGEIGRILTKVADTKNAVIDLGASLTTAPWDAWASGVTGAIGRILTAVQTLIAQVLTAHSTISNLPPVPTAPTGGGTTPPTSPPGQTPKPPPPIVIGGPTTPPAPKPPYFPPRIPVPTPQTPRIPIPTPQTPRIPIPPFPYSFQAAAVGLDAAQSSLMRGSMVTADTAQSAAPSFDITIDMQGVEIRDKEDAAQVGISLANELRRNPRVREALGEQVVLRR